MIKSISFSILLVVFLLNKHNIHAEQSNALSLDKQWKIFTKSPSHVTIAPLAKILEDKYKTLEFFERTIEELQMEAFEGDEKV